jgi:hypothetical protein
MIRRRYGASPLHLLAHALLFAAAGWVLLRVIDVRAASDVLLWFLGALVLHDLVLLPLYSLLDRAASALARRVGPPRLSAINHVRVPAALSGLALLVFLPLISGRSDPQLRRVGGIEPTGYLERWLALTAALFALSALVYAVRVHRLHRAARRRRHEQAPV